MSVQLKCYTVEVIPQRGYAKQKQIDGSNYVVMPGDDCQYSLRLTNNGSTRCDAVVSLDNDRVGVFRLHAYGNITIEHPTYSSKKFTFYRGGSSKSYSAGYQSNSPKNGLVKVTFKPEKDTPLLNEACFRQLGSAPSGDTRFCDTHFDSEMPLSRFGVTTNSAYGTSSMKEGITGLSGHSKQEFKTVKTLNHDPNNQVTIMLRLACEECSCSPGPDVVPLGTPESTTYPKPIGQYY